MAVHDQDLYKLIERLKEHYHYNINNRFIRKALLSMQIPREIWTALERLTEKTDHYQVHGYQYEELYTQIHAAATFIHHAKREILPKIKQLQADSSDSVFGRSAASPEQERILREMAINNLGPNLGVFSDLVNELYLKVVALDRRDHAGKKPVCERMSELKEMGRLLT